MLYSNSFGINSFKSLLFEEVKKLMSLEEDKKNLLTKIDVLEGLLKDLINTKDYQELESISGIIELNLAIIFDNEKAERISNKLRILIYSMSSLSKKDKDYEEQLLSKQNDYIKEINKLEIELKQLQKNYYELKDIDYTGKIIAFRRIISNLKYNNQISNEEFKIIDSFMKEKDISEKNQIRILEHIKNHNLYVKYKTENIKSTESSRKIVLDMLDLGFEQFDDIYIENESSKKRVEAIVKPLCDVLSKDEFDLNEMIDVFPNLESKDYSFEEFSAIFVTILKDLQEKIIMNIEAISTREYYDDNILREIVKMDYIKLRNKYNTIRTYYDEQVLKYESSIEEAPNENIKNNVFYGLNGMESYIEKDIKKLPSEYLYKVELLIKKFKLGILSQDESKNLNGAEQIKKLRELRDDQIRILYYHINSNNYLIVGCAVKKSDNLRRMYNSMAERNTTIDISDEDKFIREKSKAQTIEEKVFYYIKENKRRGNR